MELTAAAVADSRSGAQLAERSIGHIRSVLFALLLGSEHLPLLPENLSGEGASRIGSEVNGWVLQP